MEQSASETPRAGKDEALCFTAGPQGAAFGAGVVHAWLASDREPPLVAAGISTGALTAAAIRKSYQELESAPQQRHEEARWTWFRRYLDAVTVSPFDFIWRSLPDPVDFFADKPPVKDLSADRLEEPLRSDADDARRHFHILTKFGVWLAGLPVRVRTLACIAVYHVRYKEGYSWGPFSFTMRLVYTVKAAIGLWWHLVRSPKFFSVRGYARAPEKRWQLFRPLFGWGIWGAAIAPIVLVFLAGYLRARASLKIHPHSSVWTYAEGAAIVEGVVTAMAVELIVIAVVFLLLSKSKATRWFLPRHMLSQLDIMTGILKPFELKRRLHDLFGDARLSPELPGGKETHLLLVSAVLQQPEQVWPQPSVSMVSGLSAALAIPGIFPPERFEADQIANYDKSFAGQLIDGVAVRNNPIPAFFKWCQDKAHAGVVDRLEKAPGCSLHVVYNVPIRPSGSVADAPPREWIDIVESAQVSLALEKRRDTRQEVRQARFIAELEGYRRVATNDSGPSGEYPRYRISADEIAPSEDVQFDNAWEPSREKSLKIAAQGCRETLETLYASELSETGPEGLECARLLRRLTERRKNYIHNEAPGLPEMCGACTRTLHHRPAHVAFQPPEGVIQSYGHSGDGRNVPLRSKLFPHLAEDRPRIVFLGNGGVFRGAFHIGVIGAMKATRVFPDLVVGASVGMLMGGALASISVIDANGESAVLEDLAKTFLNVDKQVALTRTIKNAAKQLGTRARQIRLSPSEVRRSVLRGSRADAGYAATGAPPSLIDALSSLFRIPHRETAEVASLFVAGHISEAANRFLRALRVETLTSFGIERSLIGISLLLERATALLVANRKEIRRNEVQPWHYPCAGKRPVSVFGTTSFLNARVSLLLGRDFLIPDPTWDSVYAGLSSSAFPAVFSPRSEADVLPGLGRADRLFADGGLFDNLPFLPAIEILGSVQAAEREPNLEAALERLRERTQHRDVFIAAALDADPEPVGPYDTIFKIYKRSREFAANSKAESFASGSKQTREALEQIVAGRDILSEKIRPEERGQVADFFDRTVNAAVLKVIPTDKDHINRTFAFCRTTGLDPETVARSIADGCFQTLRQFSQAWESDKAVHRAFEGTEVAKGLALDGAVKTDDADCHYFATVTGRLRCPFAGAAVREIRNICGDDSKHKQVLKLSVKKAAKLPKKNQPDLDKSPAEQEGEVSLAAK